MQDGLPGAVPNKQHQSPQGGFSMTEQLHLTQPRKHQCSHTSPQQHVKDDIGSAGSSGRCAGKKRGHRAPERLLSTGTGGRGVLHKKGPKLS